jgi:hypothetical protein
MRLSSVAFADGSAIPRRFTPTRAKANPASANSQGCRPECYMGCDAQGKTPPRD